MSQIAFRYSVPASVAADLVTNAAKAQAFAKELRHDLPVSRVEFLDATKSDSVLVVHTDKDVVNIKDSSGYLHRVHQAGGAAGSTAVTGAVATSVILAVFSATQAAGVLADVTAEWVLAGHPPTAGHFDNTGGTSNTTNNMVFVFYNPPQTEAAVGTTT